MRPRTMMAKTACAPRTGCMGLMLGIVVVDAMGAAAVFGCIL
jgi:hypothetical protein